MRPHTLKLWRAAYDVALEDIGRGRRGRHRATRLANEVVRKLRTSNARPPIPQTNAGGNEK